MKSHLTQDCTKVVLKMDVQPEEFSLYGNIFQDRNVDNLCDFVWFSGIGLLRLPETKNVPTPSSTEEVSENNGQYLMKTLMTDESPKMLTAIKI